MKRLTVIYATPVAVAPTRTALEVVPELEVVDVLDEGLLRVVLDEGRITPLAVGRMISHLLQAQAIGSDAVLVTCNIYSNVIADVTSAFAGMPVLAIDSPMVEDAVATASRVGIVATGLSGLRSQLEMFTDEIERTQREVELVPRLCEGAFDALVRGDAATHDRLVQEAIDEMSQDLDVVVLAQASMARVLDGRAEGPVPVLSSPRIAMPRLRELLGT
ncbi:MAG TPA: aspartate/glutamate racemase family protein [Galbitalea sp.]